MSDGGVKYFPLDVHLDDRYELIEAEFGLTGFAIVVKLHQKIFSIGYYCEWNDDVALLFTKKVGCSAVSEIVSASIRRGIFDESLFKKYHILTSKKIQETYFEIVSRWKKVEVKKEYLLIDATKKYKNVNIIAENVNILKENDYISEQIKENKIKENKSKKDITPAAPIRHKYGQYQNVLLSDEDMRKLQSEFPDWKDRIERLSEYMASAGKQYKSHLATIRSWSRRDSEAAITSKPQQKNSFNRYSKPGGEEEDEALLRLIAEKQMRERSGVREQQT